MKSKEIKMSNLSSLVEIQKKLEYYCVYQDRCHQEVKQKLYELGVNSSDMDLIVVHLIEHNFLNEERFARSFARGKHRIKFWGLKRIKNELTARNISSANIKLGLTEISNEEYQATFETIADRTWNSILERNVLKKRKKFCDYLLRKGWESEMIYQKMKEFEDLK